MISSFVTPLLYVLAMGVLLGGFIEGDPATLEGATSYLAFVAPGLVAAHAMQIVFGEMTYPVMGMVKWQRIYFGMTRHAARRAATWSGAPRRSCSSGWRRPARCSSLVLAPFGVFASVVGSVAGVPHASCWSGWPSRPRSTRFSAPGSRTRARSRWSSGSGVIPLFLFSRRVLPDRQPRPGGRVARRCTPLWHGVDLTRMFTLGTSTGRWPRSTSPTWSVLAVAGWFWAVRRLDEAAGLVTAMLTAPSAASPRSRRATAADDLPQLPRLPRGLVHLPHRLPRAGLLPVLDRHRRRPAGRPASSSTASTIPYAEFVAPGMLAASAMNGALLDAPSTSSSS